MDSDRTLPAFDNHYANTTLLGNWREDRCVAAAGPRVFTLSGASPQCHARLVQEWAMTNTTYQAAFGKDGEPTLGATGQPLERGVAAKMERPRGLGKELLLGTGEADALVFSGAPESEEYGAFWSGITGGEFGDSWAASRSGSTGADDAAWRAKVHDLFSSTAAARQQRGVRNLYESNQLAHSHSVAAQGSGRHRGSRRAEGHQGVRKTFRDTQGRERELAPADVMADVALFDRFATTKMGADIPVAHYYFQRRLPPPEA